MFSASNSNFVTSGDRKGRKTRKGDWCLTEDFKVGEPEDLKVSEPEELDLTHKDTEEGERILPLETRKKRWKSRKCHRVGEEATNVGFL